MFYSLYDIIIVSLTTVHELSQSYPGTSVLIHSLLCLQEKKNIGVVEPDNGLGFGIIRSPFSSAFHDEQFLKTPPSDTLPLHPMSTYRNL